MNFRILGRLVLRHSNGNGALYPPFPPCWYDNQKHNQNQNQNQLGKENVYLSYTSRSQFTDGSQGRSSKHDPRSRNHGRVLFAALLPGLTSASQFLYSSRQLPRDRAAHSGLGFSHIKYQSRKVLRPTQ